jgi:hypothetical protein
MSCLLSAFDWAHWTVSSQPSAHTAIMRKAARISGLMSTLCLLGGFPAPPRPYTVCQS